LKEKIKPGGKSIVNRGYVSSRRDKQMLSQPNACETARRWTTSKVALGWGRRLSMADLKFFDALSQTFRHHVDKHTLVLEAVWVTVQYQMDNGLPVFDVWSHVAYVETA
jgi:hypothetical protein